MLPTTMAAAPSAARSCAAARPGTPGITSNQSRTTMKKEPFTTRADSTALAGGGAPACAGGSQRCSGKSAVLARSPTVISAAGDERRGIGAGPAGQQHDVEHAVRAVEQHRADEVEDRSHQREERVAERGREGRRLTVQANQRDRREGQELQRDVQREEITRPGTRCSTRPRPPRSRSQKASGARASAVPAGVWNSVRAKTPTPQITTAVVTIMTAARASARSTTPSGGTQPPSR